MTRRPDRRLGRPDAGFSLFELIIVLVIVVTLSAIAAPRFANALTGYRAEVSARRIVADLALARAQARQASRARLVTFDLAGHRVTIADANPMADAGPVRVTRLAEEPYRAELVSADFGGDAKVVFDGYGVPDSGGQAVVGHGGTSATVVLDANSGQAEVN
jgi:prepilin-type N-terminal cleavage/methylation domain-containing protein